MITESTVTFQVPGFPGDFQALVEPPAISFLEANREMAKTLGGAAQYAEMQSYVALNIESDDPVKRQGATITFNNIVLAQNFVELKRCLLKTPQGFSFGKLQMPEFQEVWRAFEVAREPFRSPGPNTNPAPAKDTEPEKPEDKTQ